MRFIPRNCIQEEAVLARSIIGANGEVLLMKGTKMKPRYIMRLEELGINGAFVNDPISEDLEIIDALSDEIRSYAVKNMLSIYTKAARNDVNPGASAKLAMEVANTIVDEILSKGEIMFNIMDLKAFDSYTFFHCVNVTVLSVIMGIGMQLTHSQLVDLAYASLLHDIGKVFIDASIINKPGKLTPEEFEVIKKHARDGYNYIKQYYYINTSELSALGVLEHHERIDGSGYPDKKKGKEITPFGRILSIADVYDALISDRPYRKGMFPVEAVEYIQGGCGTLFDFDTVNVFSQKIALFPVGTCVMLSNQATGLVMENYEGFAQRPLLKVFRQDDRPVSPYLLNLRQSAFDITIVSTVAV